jgi:hypothetical protein
VIDSVVMLVVVDVLVVWCCGDNYFILDAGWMVSPTQPLHRLLHQLSTPLTVS